MMLFFMMLFFSVQSRCTRDNPPCKFYHPPQQLKDQLLINGRNHLAMKNIMVQQLQMQQQQQTVSMPAQLQMQVQTVQYYISIFLEERPPDAISQNLYCRRTKIYQLSRE